MAQPVFDEHPLEQYLRDAGETSEPMPGGSAEFTVQEEEWETSDNGDYAEACPAFLKPILDVIMTLLSMNSSTAFVERFKYAVISSSLLSSSLAPPKQLGTHRNLREHSPHPPGKLPSSNQHSRESSLASSASSSSPQHQHEPVHSLLFSSEQPYQLFFLALAFVTVFFGAGYYFLSMSLFAASAFLLYIYNMDLASRHDMTPSLDTLNELISAGDVWDSVVHEAITILEKEEQSSYSTSTSIPSHSLRVALHSTLVTTQTQCDNVRHLFSALTSQNELAQLSEMYAPPSPGPSKGGFGFPTSPNMNGARPLSLPESSRQRTHSAPTSRESKRSTWSGYPASYSSLANASSLSPTKQNYFTTRRREKRRSDLSALLQVTGGMGSPLGSSVSAPVSPAAGGLEGVQEAEEDDQAFDEAEEEESFGAAALDMRRKRRSGGLEALTLGLPSSSSSPPRNNKRNSAAFPLRSPLSPRFQFHHQQQQPTPPSSRPTSTILYPSQSAPQSLNQSPNSTSPHKSTSFVSGSRFTPLKPPPVRPRHPLSLSSLHLALSTALAAKRYTCSYLLALRFDEERGSGDDANVTTGMGYWEDVRSVMGLLTSTFVDASARLVEVLEAEADRGNMDTSLSEAEGDASFDDSFGEEEEPKIRAGGIGRKPKSLNLDDLDLTRATDTAASFAPQPSQLTRFAAHVDAISNALNDARAQLEECVEELRGELVGRKRSSTHSSTRDSEDNEEQSRTRQDHPSLQAYERLRRELGLALRECERGREKLLDLVYPPAPAQESLDHEELEDEGEAEDVPQLGHDHASSDESSDKVLDPFVEYGDNKDVAVVNLDDASNHLLLATSTKHLPPPGIEQVFEASTFMGEDGNGWRRERSKLSREDRIRLVKERRESLGLARASLVAGGEEEEGDAGRRGEGTNEKWGPGGEVVQELKDVIWQVGEKRRKMMVAASKNEERRSLEVSAPAPALLASESEPELGRLPLVEADS
ncbi:hypothetical protein VKT23_014989 [Stygiomarasmius scandens]|uniref:Myosin-binding domain-containing protein n=1 Tax=Marasmiellus scandens TaxID=2682957 RepID=A0ABR1IYV0_9AGAR